jgi:uncharacterized protein YwqG
LVWFSKQTEIKLEGDALISPTELSAELHQAGLGEIAGAVERLAQPSIRLISHPDGDRDGAIGASRLGGNPDLPPDTPWPACQDIPMSFIAQINLAAIDPYDLYHVLPPKGLLSFFYDSKQQIYGDQPDDRRGWKVMYFPETPNGLELTPFPAGLPREARFNRCDFTCSNELTLPSAPKQIDPNLPWTPGQTQSYENFLSSYPTPGDHAEIHHRMLGYPEQLQDDMQLQCALVSHGFKSTDEPGAQKYVAHKSDWQLLLQVDSDENAGMRWGSSGMLYYWIELQDLQAQRFNRVWLILQSE